MAIEVSKEIIALGGGALAYAIVDKVLFFARWVIDKNGKKDKKDETRVLTLPGLTDTCRKHGEDIQVLKANIAHLKEGMVRIERKVDDTYTLVKNGGKSGGN